MDQRWQQDLPLRFILVGVAMLGAISWSVSLAATIIFGSLQRLQVEIFDCQVADKLRKMLIQSSQVSPAIDRRPNVDKLPTTILISDSYYKPATVLRHSCM